MPSFDELLNKNVDDIKAPPALPTGTYLATVDRYEMVESSQKKTPGVRVFFKIQSADEDVDQDELAKFNEISGDVAGKEVRDDFWLTDASVFRMKDFCVDVCGIDGKGRMLSEILPEINGCSVKIIMKQEYVQQEGKAEPSVFSRVAGHAAI